MKHEESIRTGSVYALETRCVQDPDFIHWLRGELRLADVNKIGGQFAAAILEEPIAVSPYVNRYGLAGFVINVRADDILLITDFTYPNRRVIVASPCRVEWSERREYDRWQAVVMFIWRAGLMTPPGGMPALGEIHGLVNPVRLIEPAPCSQ